MVNLLHLFRTNIEAIQHHFPLQFLHIHLDMVVLNHNHHHINSLQELIEIQHLILHNLLVGKERVETLQRTGKMPLLTLNHLEGRTFTNVIHILLIGDAIKTDSAIVGNAVLLHNLVDAVEHELRLAVVGAHTLVNDLGE